MEKEFVLISEQGLHARPATNFVKYISSLPFSVYLIYKDFVADAKSIMAIMSIGLSKDSTFKIRVESDNPEHLKQVEQYLKENHLI